MLVVQLMQELCQGVDSFKIARQRRETGGWTVEMALGIDAMSVFSAATATQLKIPAEKALWSHVQYVRELLDTGVLDYALWLDTRDMWSDGLTKGTVERTLIHEIMQGVLWRRHACKVWAPKVRRPAGSDPPPLEAVSEEGPLE